MHIIVIGDIHGRPVWKQIVEKNKRADLIIFLGDYHDVYSSEFKSKDISLIKDRSITNLFEIMELKKTYPDKIVLLLGNHDTHYMYNIERCSRFDRDNRETLQNIFIKNKELFQYAWQKDDHIFVHGGILQKWFDYWKDKLLIPAGLNEDLSNLADTINIVGDDRHKGTNAVNDIPRLRGGNSPFGGPTWADLDELIDYTGANTLKGFHQYVGHNKAIKIEKIESKGDSTTSVTLLDVLHPECKDELDLKYLSIEI